MSIKVLYSSEKTNSFRPTPWAWTEKPFPAFRGEGARHRGFLAVGKGYEPAFGLSASGFDPTPTKLIKTEEKQTLLVVPCLPESDEQIMLITLRGGFRGSYSRIEVEGGEILFNQGSNVHCCPTAHLVVRLTHPNGYVFAETGRRCSTGLVEVFSWGGYTTLPTEEFEVWRKNDAPDLSDDARASAKAKAEVDRVAGVARAAALEAEAEAKAKATAEVEAIRRTNALRMRPILEPRLGALSTRRVAIGLAPIRIEEEFYSNSSWSRCEYTEAEVEKTEAEVVAAEVKHAEKKAFEAGVAELESRMEAVALGFSAESDRFVARGKEGYNQYFSYDGEGLARLHALVESLETCEAKAKAEAEAKAERERQETAASASNLPSNVEIWKRRGGATNAGDGWVIQPNGMPREPDEMRCPRPRYPHEGTQAWRQILPGELVLHWAKAYTAAEHEFRVIYRPDSLTHEQERMVALLQEELAEAYESARGLASGLPSPSIGPGWNLLPSEHPVQVVQGGERASASHLAALQDRFGK